MWVGWNSHFGINQLTRAKLAALSVIEQEEYELKLVVGADKIKMTPPTLDAKDEENTSAIELLEAYPAFITLIREHYKGGNNEHAQRLADEFQAMFAAPDFYSCFKTYLFYDIGLRKQFPRATIQACGALLYFRRARIVQLFRMRRLKQWNLSLSVLNSL
jgi:hypothetical protein